MSLKMALRGCENVSCSHAASHKTWTATSRTWSLGARPLACVFGKASPQSTASSSVKPGRLSLARRRSAVVQARKTVDLETLPRDIIRSQERIEQNGTSISWLLGRCTLIGLTFGSLFQFCHNEGFLPVYDVWAVKIGPLHHAGTIPFVLAPIWILYGYLQPVLDSYLDDENTRKVNQWASSLTFVSLNWAVLAAQFILSDYLYLAGYPHWQCSVVMAASAAAIYKAFDNTRGGLLLAALLAVGAPLGEMFIVNVLHWWHYEHPDINGVCHWTGFCYATYSIGVGNVARYLVQKRRNERRIAEKGL